MSHFAPISRNGHNLGDITFCLIYLLISLNWILYLNLFYDLITAVKQNHQKFPSDFQQFLIDKKRVYQQPTFTKLYMTLHGYKYFHTQGRHIFIQRSQTNHNSLNFFLIFISLKTSCFPSLWKISRICSQPCAILH